MAAVGRGGSGGSSSGNGGGDRGGGAGTTQALVWVVYGAYMVWLFLLPYAPGDPVWRIQPSTFEEVTALSLNFFYILPLLNKAGVHVMEAPSLHPAAEALFNLVNAWSLMFGPLLLRDQQLRREQARRGSLNAGSVFALWSAQMFLTNVFLLPYMALRLQPAPDASTPTSDGRSAITNSGSSITDKAAAGLASQAGAVGAVGGTVALLSLWWLAAGRMGEGFGDALAARLAYLAGYVGSDRLAYAFVFDVVLYSACQAWIVSDMLRCRGLEGRKGITNNGYTIPPLLFYVPCVGLALFLLIDGHSSEPE